MKSEFINQVFAACRVSHSLRTFAANNSKTCFTFYYLKDCGLILLLITIEESLFPSMRVMEGLKSCFASVSAALVKNPVVTNMPLAVTLNAPLKLLISTLY